MTTEMMQMGAMLHIGETPEQEYDRLLNIVEAATRDSGYGLVEVQAAVFLLQFKHGDKSAQSQRATDRAEMMRKVRIAADEAFRTNMKGAL